MVSRWRTLVLLLVLGMLQGMLPMLHAHVGGQAVRTGAHLPMMAIDAQAASQDAHAGLDHLSNGESPEISVGQFIERRQQVAVSLPEQALPPALDAWRLLNHPTSPRPVPHLALVRPRSACACLPPPALAPPLFLS